MADSYGLDPQGMADTIAAHKRAREAQDHSALRAIQDRLTDINYHTILNLMDAGEYDKAAQRYKRDHERAAAWTAQRDMAGRQHDRA